MRPGQLTANEFESAILSRIAQQVPALAPSAVNLHVLSREFTGVGSFTHFAPSDVAVELPDGVISLGSLIEMPDVPNGMGAAIFLKGGYIDFLETFTYGSDHWDGAFSGFQLLDA
jgi:hypothetical protein